MKRKLSINDFEIVKNESFESYKKREIELFEPNESYTKEVREQEIDEDLLVDGFSFSAYYDEGFGGFKECGEQCGDKGYDQLDKQEYKITIEAEDGTEFEITVKIKDESGHDMQG